MEFSVSLKTARKNRKDEYYTLYEDIEKELYYYRDFFKDKVIYCNCDDYRYSNFVKYFKDNFDRFGLKRLVSTCYSFTDVGVKFVKDKDTESVFKLNGSGSYNSRECLEILQKSDIIITNPPYSLLMDYMDLIVNSKKDFIILGSLTVLAYSKIFPYIKDKTLRLGIHNSDTKWFRVPDDYISDNKGTAQRIDNNKVYQKQGNTCWFTDFIIDRSVRSLNLSKRFKDYSYKSFDNYKDIISIDKVCDIPIDYNGLMGVPITFLERDWQNYYNVLGLLHDAISDSKMKFKRVVIKKI